MKRFLMWLYRAELDDFIWTVFSRDLYARIDNVEKTYRTAKEMVMQRKLRDLGFDVQCVFPKPSFTTNGEIPLEQLPNHPTGFFEIIAVKAQASEEEK